MKKTIMTKFYYKIVLFYILPMTPAIPYLSKKIKHIKMNPTEHDILLVSSILIWPLSVPAFFCYSRSKKD